MAKKASPTLMAALELIGACVIEDEVVRALCEVIDVSDVQNAAKALLTVARREKGSLHSFVHCSLMNLQHMHRALLRSCETKHSRRAHSVCMPSASVCHSCSRHSAHRMRCPHWRWNRTRSSSTQHAWRQTRHPATRPFSSKPTRPRSLLTSAASSTHSRHLQRARPCRRRCGRCWWPSANVRTRGSSRSSRECATACSEATSSSASSTPPL